MLPNDTQKQIWLKPKFTMNESIKKQTNMRQWCITGNTSPFQGEVSGSNPDCRITLELVKKSQRFMMNQVIKNYHSYRQGYSYSGRQINWWVKNDSEIVGVIGIGSCVYICPVRDKYIGYKVININNKTKDELKDYFYNVKLKSYNHIANNWRFTLMPDAPENCGSKTLSLLLKEAPREWEKQYKDKLVLLETFVEPPREGTIYKANGWISIGLTKGDSTRSTIEQCGFSSGNNWKNDGGHFEVTKKLVFIKPLHRYWKRVLLKEKEGDPPNDLSRRYPTCEYYKNTRFLTVSSTNSELNKVLR